jgi:aquaporin Z
MKKYLAEYLGTFALVFCGTGAIVINEQTHGAIGNLGIAIAFGFIVMAMIYVFGNVSGAHLNPAVTIGFNIAGKLHLREAVPYISCQLLGACTASVVLRLLFPDNVNLGTTLPTGLPMESFWIELFLSFMLMLAILRVSHGSRESGLMAAFVVGTVIFFEALFAGPVTGASMNPARSLAPALISGNLNHLWIYLTAPFLGALSAVGSWKLISKNK